MLTEAIPTKAQHCSPATLVHLNIIAGQPPIPVVSQLPNPAMVPIEFFRPLSHYRLLESASLGESGGATGLTDDDYAELAQWWPNMVHLRIPNVTGTASTLKALLAFARHCKRLETVNLKLDAYSLSLSSDEIADAIPGGVPALKRLEINDGRIGTTDDVADCLSTLFPALMEVVYRGNDEWHFYDDDDEGPVIAREYAWDRVSRMLRWHRKVKNGPWVDFEDFEDKRGQ